ncbi:hypothetical protein BOTBODRAFT_177969 [Botryobasidium botryosum FD-172 SS1]|uniref:Uncharacterized protein n=1 Tax=Botryobasidium botryosum (strain FD-172 SS1) TaxID=930990 RepID=A0A067MFL4_BOTB1|nr:hypothetical protein BOTBODRAFT_177969 [Botryobasidium botryosum FD-172 SS1]
MNPYSQILVFTNTFEGNMNIGQGTSVFIEVFDEYRYSRCALTQTAVSGPLVWLPHGFNWRRVPTTPEHQPLRNALALYALHHEEILPSILTFELEQALPASTPYYPVSMAYLDYRRLRQAYFNSNSVLSPEHFLHHYLASHEVQIPYYFTSHPTRKLLMPVVDNPPPSDTTILDRAAQYARELPLPYPVIIPPWIPTQHPRSWVVDDIRKPPPFVVENYVIPLLEAITLTGTPVFTIQLPDHSIGERTHAANLALMGALRNMPAHLLMPDLALVIANRAIIDGLTNPSRRTVYHSHLHDLASRAILACPTTLHIFVINKFHTLHPPKKAFYYRPPTNVPELIPYYFTSHPTRKLLMPVVDNPPPSDTTILDRAAQYARELPLPYPVIIPPWIPTQHPRSWVVDDIRKPPPFVVENYVIPLLEAITLTGTPVFTIQLPDHSIGERTHAANLALMGALRNMPAHLLMPDLALVIANRAIIDGLTNPSRRTVYHSHLHDLASRAILACPTTLHIFVINKFHTLHPPKKAFYYRPPTNVPELFTEMAPSCHVATRRYKQLLAQAFAEDLEENIPQDHIVRTFDLLRDAEDTTYPPFIDLQRPVRETALLTRIASGHCKVGSYFLKMHIDEPEAPIACPCGTIDIQTIVHVISECPITAPARHLIEDDDGDVDLATLFTSKLDPFLKWLKAMHSFTCHFGEELGPVSPRQGATSLVGFSVVD